MRIDVLFGTESGNSELAAEDLSTHLVTGEHSSQVRDLAGLTAADLETDTGKLYVFICSTYGEGDLPNTAIPFFESLVDAGPDLTGMQYALFGLGDSFYEETFANGSAVLDAKLSELGARRVGVVGRHDASSWEPVGEKVIEWFDDVLQAVCEAV